MTTRPAERQEGVGKDGQAAKQPAGSGDKSAPHPDSNPNTDPKNPINDPKKD